MLSEKQKTILKVIQKGIDGDFVDLDQLLELVDYETTKQSMQFSIRALVNRRLIEKLPTETRRGRARVRYRITRDGRAVLSAVDSDIAAAVIEIENDYGPIRDESEALPLKSLRMANPLGFRVRY